MSKRKIEQQWAIAINRRELSVILAGLRLFQESREGEALGMDAYKDIASNGGSLRPLSYKEIDHLCERINS